MKRGLLGVFVVVTLLATGVVLLPLHSAARSDGISERWINANLVQVEINGSWQDVPMVPLADHACQSDDPMYSRYCD
jgi:hypothetical protein